MSLGLSAALALAACYGSSGPTNNPGDASQLIQSITRRGATVVTTVSGESACADPSLVNNALHLTVSDATDPAPRDVFIYTFRQKSWDASKAAVDACQASYAAAHPGATIERLDVPTYRSFGASWSPSLRLLLASALSEASNAGEPPEGM